MHGRGIYSRGKELVKSKYLQFYYISHIIPVFSISTARYCWILTPKTNFIKNFNFFISYQNLLPLPLLLSKF